MPDNIPFGIGKERIVNVKINPKGIHDIYIDNLIGLGLDLPDCDNTKRSERAPLLAINAFSWRIHKEEPIPYYDMAACHKLIAEGLMEESKMILGWKWDFWCLTISLPPNKFTAWTNDINKMIIEKKVTAKELESTIGRLTHVSLIIPTVHHFLSRLRELHHHAKYNNRQSTNIPQICINNLKLMTNFLEHGSKGISMNQITYRKPTHIYRSDTCPAGMGGYSHEGFVWQFYLPNNLKFRASNNLLEHMAGIISPWGNILVGHLNDGDCSLSMMDSTTSKGWMRKTNFKEDKNRIQATIRIEVARSHTARFMDHGIRKYSQWFRGIENDMAYALSRDMDRSDDKLTQILFTHVPSQVPNSLKIVPLPNKIVSWATSLLWRLPVQPQYSKEHTKTMLGCGSDGKNTANPQASKKINIP
jgi:hypothetical protein